MAAGGKREGAGRKKGEQNKATLEFKEAINNLIAFATPQMIDWLERVALDSPDKALDMVYKFAQFGYPLLARQDNTSSDGSMATKSIEVKIVKSASTNT